MSKTVLESQKYISNVIGFDGKLETTNAIRIEGYFQTYKYVEKILESKPNFLKLEVESPSQWYSQMKQQVEAEQAIGIHIRGGDYLKDVNNSFGNLSSEYYLNAINMLSEARKITDPVFYIFTDDVGYANQLLGKLNLSLKMKFIEPPLESKPTESMMLMSRTKVKIISNSTFAWWAGYLGSENCSVIAPSKWFKGKEDPDFIIPKNWKICESRWTTDILHDDETVRL
jgi:hypothetical protein